MSKLITEENIKRKVATLLKIIDIEQKVFEKIVSAHVEHLERIATELTNVRNSCMHTKTEGGSDPSGGSGGWTTCKICGKEW